LKGRGFKPRRNASYMIMGLQPQQDARSGMAFRPEKRSFQRPAFQAEQRRKTEN
jgi:hypothetical protein